MRQTAKYHQIRHLKPLAKKTKIALLIMETEVTLLNWAFQTFSSNDWKDLLKWAGVPVLSRTTSSQTSFQLLISTKHFYSMGSTIVTILTFVENNPPSSYLKDVHF